MEGVRERESQQMKWVVEDEGERESLLKMMKSEGERETWSGVRVR